MDGDQSQKRAPCDSSCYDCLRSFRNMQYHGILDWRLGLSYLRILTDSQYACGIYDPADFDRPELRGWMEQAGKLGNSFAKLFGYDFKGMDPLPWMEGDGIAVIVTHPLWDTYDPKGLLAKAKAIARTAGDPVFIDTFNLARRPGWCHIVGRK